MKRLIFAVFSVILMISCLLVQGVFSNTVLVYSSINGIRIFIDPGHGGYDPGTHYDGVLEKEINMGIASYLYEEILSCFGQAYISRTGDYDLAKVNSNNHKMEDLKNRVKMINESGADLLISLHLNAINDKSVFGPMVYYRSNDEESKSFANNIQNSLNEFSSLSKIIHPERYYIFKKTIIPAVLIECGFLSNVKERKKLLDKNYQKELSKSIIKGIDSYLKEKS